jgi:lipopolysaccharide biosynthesis glycosyltransferase
MPSQWARKNWPLTAAARFQVAEVVPKDIDRCLYLDIDVLAGVDVAELFDVELRGNPIGMVQYTRMPEKDKEYLRTRLNLDPDVYCNSGVALIDLDAWRREGAGQGLIGCGRAMPPNIWFYDQDILNTYFKGRCLLLEERWNYRDSAALPDGKIQHFAGSTKPWKVTAATAPGAGHVAWHSAKQRSGFEALPIPAYVKWRKTFTVLTAKVQRRISELARKFAPPQPTPTHGPLASTESPHAEIMSSPPKEHFHQGESGDPSA